MNILALDLGSRTGWALYSPGMSLSGFVDFKNGRHEGGGMRFLRFRHWLNEQHRALQEVNAVYYEEVRRHVGTDAAHVYGGLLGILTAWCEQHRIPYCGVPVGTIKKHATGKGNADKAAMVAAAQKLMGRVVEDDNEADALCILHYALQTEGVNA